MYPRSMSVHLPKDASSSTVARSVISAPILTSTTNAKVAAVEGVECGNIHDDLSNSAHQTTALEARHLAEKMQTKQPEDNSRQRLVDVLKKAIRRRERSSFTKIDEETVSVSRRRAETVNLCKTKIKTLTGNGHVRRKSINNTDKNAVPDTQGLSRKTSRAALIDLSRRSSQAALVDFDSQLGNDSPFGSLTRSFNSALEKLDFQTQTVSFLRSRSSVFSMRTVDDKQEGVPKMSPYEPPYTPRPGFAKLNQEEPTKLVTEGNNMATSIDSEDGDRPQKGQDIKQVTQDVNAMVITKPYDQMVRRDCELQHPNSNYVAANCETNHREGKDGLRMHPDTMAMAEVPEGYKAEEHVEPKVGQDNESVYSPFTGNLGQYARSSAATEAMPTPAATPTKSLLKGKFGKKGDEKQGPVVKKSKSFFGIFKKDETPPPVPRTASPFMPTTPSPLRRVHVATPDEKKRYGVVGMPKAEPEDEDVEGQDDD